MFTLAQANQELHAAPQHVVDYAWDVVKREGGYTDNANDPGGATNHGVSLKYAREHGLLFDLNDDGAVTAADIKLITPEMAVVCFLMDFFLTPGFDKLPGCVQADMMDFSVNAGIKTAGLALQQTLNRLRTAKIATWTKFAQIEEDGETGPETISFAHTIHISVGEAALTNALVEQREAYYRDIVKEHPNMQEFLRGWIARAETFREQTVPNVIAPALTPAPASELQASGSISS